MLVNSINYRESMKMKPKPLQRPKRERKKFIPMQFMGSIQTDTKPVFLED